MQISRRCFLTSVGKITVLLAMTPMQPGLTVSAQQPSPSLGYGQGSYGAGSYPAAIERTVYLPVITKGGE